jgi:hypothetical protein
MFGRIFADEACKADFTCGDVAKTGGSSVFVKINRTDIV